MWRLDFDPSALHVEFVKDTLVLVLVFFRALRFFPLY